MIIEFRENELEDFGQCLEEMLHMGGKLMGKVEEKKRKMKQMQERSSMDYRDGGYNMQERNYGGGSSMHERGRYSVNMPAVYDDERDSPYNMHERGGNGRGGYSSRY